jgi:hypothetical protein
MLKKIFLYGMGLSGLGLGFVLGSALMDHPLIDKLIVVGCFCILLALKQAGKMIKEHRDNADLLRMPDKQ